MAEDILKTDDSENTFPICGFWKRVIALIIDGIILAIIGALIGTAFQSFFVTLGSNGRWIGLPILLIYFGILNSEYGKGRTIGKFLVKICVVGRNGQYISLPRSLIRSFILELPFIANGTDYNLVEGKEIAIAILSFLVFVVVPVIAYLYIFNCRTRQSLHDIIATTFVIDTKRYPTQNLNTLKIWKGHFLISSILALSIIIAGYSFFQQASKGQFKEDLDILEKMQTDIMTMDSLLSVKSIFVNKLHDLTDKTVATKNILTVTALLKHEPTSQEDIENKTRAILKMLLDNYDLARQQHEIYITCNYGYDIGIWKTYKTWTRVFFAKHLEQQTNQVK